MAVTDLAIGAGTPAEAWRSAGRYLRRFVSATPRQKSRLVKKAPLADLHVTAVHHPDAHTRRSCRLFLAHYANEASATVFAATLHDTVAFVRNVALHPIACESCRTAELSLLRLADRDSRAREAIRRAAERNSDPFVRRGLADVRYGHFVLPRKRYERHQRRHGRRRG